jgi:hypothetical protein
MASSINEQQVLWSSASSISLNSASRFDSDAISLNIEDWDAALQVSADNSGTPASGDTVDVYVKWTTGDVLGDSSDDYDTDEHAEFVCRLDTFSTNTPGEDPARKTVTIDVSGKKGFKVSAVAAQGASRAITFRARLVTHRPQ